MTADPYERGTLIQTPAHRRKCPVCGKRSVLVLDCFFHIDGTDNRACRAAISYAAVAVRESKR